jgi:hypothetical protein
VDGQWRLHRVALRQNLSFAKSSPASVDDADALATAKERQGDSVIATFVDNLQRLRTAARRSRSLTSKRGTDGVG